MSDIVVFGAGGHAREVAQLIGDINRMAPGTWNLCGFLVDPGQPSVISKPLPAPVLGDAQWLSLHAGAQVVVAVGNSQARARIVSRMINQHPDLNFATLIHPRAWLAQDVVIGLGSVVFAGTQINVSVTVGSHASINLGCNIAHDTVLGDFTSLGPGVNLGGGCSIGGYSDIGTGVSVRPLARIGEHCSVGVGAVVVKDVPNACTAFGVPATPR